MLDALLLVSLSVAAPQSSPALPMPDPRRQARSAAARYEFLLRDRVPLAPYTPAAGRCDETIGRFCFRFDAGPSRPHRPEHSDVVRARRQALVAHRAWLDGSPGQADAAEPLVRFLVEEGRAAEAVDIARSHARAAGRTPASLMLLGLALHYRGAFGAAEAVFDSARAVLGTAARRRLDDVAMLLEPGERRSYARLPPAEREAYNRRFWAFSDPSMLDDGNERRSAHYARHAWIGILARAPAVTGRPAWGTDLEEILLRYGRPTSRERSPAKSRSASGFSLVETYDPHAVSFVPASLSTEGLAVVSAPGRRSELERDTARSAYASVALHRMRGLRVQAVRFPRRGAAGSRGAVLVVHGALPPDTSAPAVPVRPRGLLVVLDTLGREVTRAPAAVRVRADSVTEVGAEVALPSGSYVYRLEVADRATGVGGLAQHRIEIADPTPPALSDLLVARADGSAAPASRRELAPLGDLVLAPGSMVRVWSEAAAVARVAAGGGTDLAVEWWVESAEEPGVLMRAARWVGRGLGLVEREEPARVRWTQATSDRSAVVSFEVELGALRDGLYRLVLVVRDRVSGADARAERLVRIDSEAGAGQRRSAR